MDKRAPSLRSPRRPAGPARSCLLAGLGALAVLVALVAQAPGAGAAEPRRAGAANPRQAPRFPELPLGFSQGPSLPRTFPVRWNFSAGYFPPSDQVVLFGGAPMDLSTAWHDDTWLFTPGVGWTRGPAAPPGLTKRGGAAMAYDPDIQKLVMFGGEARAADGSETWPPYTNETWLWDGTSWTPGPAAPPDLAGRTGAEMVYDSAIDRMVLFGGSGLDRYTDTWLFDGSSWTRGPDAPAQMSPRVFFGMAYDPLANEVVVAGGDGASDVWLFDGTAWSRGPDFPDTIVNSDRERTRMAFDPQLGAVLLFGGLGPDWPSEEIDYIRVSSPAPAWTKVPQAPPVPGPFAPPSPRLDGGIVWVPTIEGMMFVSGLRAGKGGRTGYRDVWFLHEVPPVVEDVTIGPDPPFQTQGLTATLGGVTGGYFSTTVAIAWSINGEVVPGANEQYLPPQYAPGDVVQAMVQVTDALGVAGPWVASNAVTVAGATMTATDGVPGGAISVDGHGFGADEQVDVYLETEPSMLLGTVATDGLGRFFDQPLTLPDPAAGGPNQVVGIGRTSLTESAPAPFTISPGAATLDPSALVEGQSTTFSASGFIPGEQVSVSFPFDDPVTAVADDLGSIVVGLISPAEPAPGGDVIAAAASGTAWTPFTTIAAVTVTGTPLPGSIPVSVSGFEGDELVAVDVDGTGTIAIRTDLRGSAQGTLTVPVTFGLHTIDAAGLRSGITSSTTVTLDATMAVSPRQGAVGTPVSVFSGPGWVPGSAVDLYAQQRFVGTFTADATGTVDAEVTIPELPPGRVVFRFHDSILGLLARATFRVTP